MALCRVPSNLRACLGYSHTLPASFMMLIAIPFHHHLQDVIIRQLPSLWDTGRSCLHGKTRTWRLPVASTPHSDSLAQQTRACERRDAKSRMFGEGVRLHLSAVPIRSARGETWRDLKCPCGRRDFASAAHVLQASGDARFDDMARIARRNQNEIEFTLAIRFTIAVLFPRICLVIVLLSM